MNTADMKLTTFFHTFKIKLTEGPEKNHQDWNALAINSSSSGRSTNLGSLCFD